MATVDLNQNLIQSRVLKQLQDRFHAKRLAHAYLFIGPPDVGKTDTAIAFAQWLSCDCDKARADAFVNCGESNCRRIAAGHHPDVFVIRGDHDNPIKIEQIRDVIGATQLRPFMGDWKIFIISGAEYLTSPASNALLKTLEEPTDQSLLILTASNGAVLLDTIKSRCHQLRFAVASRELTRQHIQSCYQDISPKQVDVLAAMTEGRLGQVHHYVDSKFLVFRDRVIDGFILGSSKNDFLKTIQADKNKMRSLLDVCYSWVHDAQLLQQSLSENFIIHVDRLDELKRFSQRFSMAELKRMSTVIVKSRQALSVNFNVKIPLNVLAGYFG